MMQTIKNNRWALICVWILGLFYASAIFAGFLAPYSYDDESRDFSFCPPMPIKIFDQGHIVGPFVEGRVLRFDENRRRIYDVDESKKYPLKFFHQGHLFGVA